MRNTDENKLLKEKWRDFKRLNWWKTIYLKRRAKFFHQDLFKSCAWERIYMFDERCEKLSFVEFVKKHKKPVWLWKVKRMRKRREKEN